MDGEKQYQDLEERTYLFAKQTRDYVKLLSHSLSHIEYGKQLIRSSGSVGANYIEANECISKKDFYHRIKICRKEAKESRLWLRLTIPNKQEEVIQEKLIQEAMELTKIFSSMAAKNTTT
jgi:four helix bundle protein